MSVDIELNTSDGTLEVRDDFQPWQTVALV